MNENYNMNNNNYSNKESSIDPNNIKPLQKCASSPDIKENITFEDCSKYLYDMNQNMKIFEEKMQRIKTNNKYYGKDFTENKERDPKSLQNTNKSLSKERNARQYVRRNKNLVENNVKNKEHDKYEQNNINKYNDELHPSYKDDFMQESNNIIEILKHDNKIINQKIKEVMDQIDNLTPVDNNIVNSNDNQNLNANLNSNANNYKDNIENNQRNRKKNNEAIKEDNYYSNEINYQEENNKDYYFKNKNYEDRDNKDNKEVTFKFI